MPEELIAKFRPSSEEELHSTLISLLESVEAQDGSITKADEEDGVIAPVCREFSGQRSPAQLCRMMRE